MVMIKMNFTLFFLFIALMLFGCNLVSFKPAAYRPLLEISITDFSTCLGLDEQGNPLRHTGIFTTPVKKISVCGHLETNREPVYISAEWRHKGNLVFCDRLEVFEGYFYSTYEPEDKRLALGKYTVHIIVGKNSVQNLEVEVVRPNR